MSGGCVSESRRYSRATCRPSLPSANSLPEPGAAAARGRRSPSGRSAATRAHWSPWTRRPTSSGRHGGHRHEPPRTSSSPRTGTRCTSPTPVTTPSASTPLVTPRRLQHRGEGRPRGAEGHRNGAGAPHPWSSSTSPRAAPACSPPPRHSRSPAGSAVTVINPESMTVEAHHPHRRRTPRRRHRADRPASVVRRAPRITLSAPKTRRPWPGGAHRERRSVIAAWLAVVCCIVKCQSVQWRPLDRLPHRRLVARA